MYKLWTASVSLNLNLDFLNSVLADRLRLLVVVFALCLHSGHITFSFVLQIFFNSSSIFGNFISVSVLLSTADFMPDGNRQIELKR